MDGAGGCAGGFDGSSVERCSSIRISSSSVFRSSLDAFLNSARLLPRERWSAFRVTPALLAMGLAFALLMGLVGGVPPAVRAARARIAVALREL